MNTRNNAIFALPLSPVVALIGCIEERWRRLGHLMNSRKVDLCALATALIATLVAHTAGAQPATYHDVAAMDAAIVRLDGAAGGRMQVHDIGTTANGRPVRAVHISATPNLYGTGAEASMADKPALLIECGMHAREWAGPELCLKYLQTFPLALLLDPIRINDILANADIWVIPMVNPDGRARDDTAGGDRRSTPRTTTRLCGTVATRQAGAPTRRLCRAHESLRRVQRRDRHRPELLHGLEHRQS